MLLGLETYSYNLALSSRKMDIFGFIRRAHELGLDGVQLNMGNAPPRWAYFDGIEAGRLRAIRELIEELKLYVEVCVSHHDVTNLRQALDVCTALGARILRTYQIPQNEVVDTDKAISSLKQAIPHCREAGVRIAYENHEYQTAVEILQLIQSVDSEWVRGFCDNGNGMNVWEDPDVTVETLAPYSVTNHFTDRVVIQEAGQAVVVGVALGQGSMDLEKHFRILSQSPVRQINIIVCYGYRAPFRRPQSEGASGKLGEGAFKVLHGPFDPAFIPPDSRAATPQDLAWEDQAVEQSVRYMKQLRERCNGTGTE